MWIDVSCPKCAMNRRINGVGRCGVCHALLIVSPARHRRAIDCRGSTAFRWYADSGGSETIHKDDGAQLVQERGVWARVQSDFVVFERVDHRRSVRVEAWRTAGWRGV